MAAIAAKALRQFAPFNPPLHFVPQIPTVMDPLTYPHLSTLKNKSEECAYIIGAPQRNLYEEKMRVKEDAERPFRSKLEWEKWRENVKDNFPAPLIAPVVQGLIEKVKPATILLDYWHSEMNDWSNDLSKIRSKYGQEWEREKSKFESVWKELEKEGKLTSYAMREKLGNEAELIFPVLKEKGGKLEQKEWVKLREEIVIGKIESVVKDPPYFRAMNVGRARGIRVMSTHPKPPSLWGIFSSYLRESTPYQDEVVERDDMVYRRLKKVKWPVVAVVEEEFVPWIAARWEEGKDGEVIPKNVVNQEA